MDFNKYEHYNRWYGGLRAEFYVNGHGNEEMSTTKRQCLEMKVLMWLWIFLVCLCASAKLEKSECPRKCDVPLGVESGRISDHQLTAFSHYENDYRFGAHRARLRLNSWPPGYRADKTILGDTEQFPWIRIDLGAEQIVTGIATQGYENASVSEWITRYKLMYATKNEILEFVDNDGEVMIFKGNNDSNGIVKHDLAVPRITSSILLIPRNWTDNIGLRMEIYGCEPTYYFKAWLMFHNISFVYNYLNTSSDEYIQEAFKATGEIQRYFENVGGYLYNRVLRLSPQPSPQITTSAIAEVAIYCIETSVHRVRAKLRAFVHESSIFHPDYLKIRQPITCNCNPPVVDLHLKHRILESGIIWSSDKDFVLKPKVSINCSSPIQTKYRWTFFKIDRETSYFSPFMPFGLKDQPMVMLRPRLFGPGEFYVSVDVSFTNNITDTSADDFGFFRVQMPVLTAKIVAPSSIKRDAGNITIDGSGSHDAEYPQDQSKGLTFFWQCRRLCQEAPITPCFDTDSNFFSERFTIDASSLKPKCTYEFNLTVTREPRISRASHRLYIEPAIQFSVVCVINCGRKVSVKRLFSLRVVCGKEECTSLATFSWMIFSENDQGTLTRLGIKIPSDSIETFANMTQLNILKLENLSEVKDGQKFQVRVTANPYKSHFEEQAHHTFIVNAPPTNSEVQRKDKGCQVKPKEGFAIVTDFYITCLGWYDKDVPLRYAFMYTFDSSTILIQEGNVGNVTSKLPVGDPKKGYERLVDLKIFDAYGDFTSLPKKIKVRPPLASEKLLGVINNAQNNMRKLVAGNNVQKAADMAITILSVIDYNEKLKKDETFKDSVLNIMSGVKVDKINLVTKIAVITAYSTKRVDQSLPQNSQEDALTLIRKTTTFLQNVNTSAIKDLKVIGEIGENILTGIGNVLTSSSKDVDIDSPNKDPNFDVKKGRKITSECVELVNTITAEEEFCANPTIISTPYINLTACIEKATEMKVSKLLKGESGVKLPDAKDLFPPDLLDENTVVDVKLVSFKKNPYTWHPKSRSIKSSVLDVTLKNITSGKALHVEGLSKPVEMFIKNWHRERDEIKPKETFFVKPSPPKSIKNMRFHKIVLPYGDADANIRIVPSRNEELEIYIRYKVRPTPAENNFQTVVPNFSSCLSYSEENGFSDCLSDPYLFTISPSITGHMGTHFIGIRYTPQLPEMNNTQSRTRVKRSCRGANGRQKRSCVEVKPPPLPENILKLQFQNNSDVQYDLFITMGLCMYWSPKDDEWTNRGCKVGPKATPGKLQCLCTHLSAFGGDLFVAPNPIDFDKVMSEFGNLAASGNFVVLAFVCVIFGLYATGLIIARRADKIDKFEIAPNIHVIIGQDCAFTYDISIQTGIWRDCGTTANVAIILFGENGCTPPILLTQRQLGKRFFARGSVNTFTIHLQESLGSLYKIKIWHDNSGENPAWFFHQVLVTCNSTNEKWYFLGNQWLAVEKGDGKIEVDIISAGESESLSFSNLFYFRGAKTLSEKHLWLSLFTKAPHSTFTRCQRLSCCLSILFATMVANAMFYQQSTSNVDAFRVGPINLSWSQIKIGVQSGLVSIPVNVLVVAIFRNIRPSGLIDSGNSQDGEEEEEQANGCFPHFCVYIGWALCLMASLVSAAFVVFYSLMWGKTVANQWLTSVMISFFQDVIVIQPVKVVIIVSLLSLIVKKPIKNDEIRGQGHSDQSIDNSLTSSPPGNEELNKMRSVRILKRRLAKTLIEIGTCVSFLLLLVIVCYGNRDSNRFRFTTAVKHVFPNFEKVHNITSFWTWTRKNLLSGLFDVKWYNGMAFSFKEGFIRNREAFMIGMPRLRQKRIKEDPTCKAFHNEAELVRHFSRCIPHYSTETEDKTKYHLRGWIPVDDFEVFQHQFEKFYLCPRPWRYETAEQLGTLSFQGLRSTYSGGGYIADLGYNTDDALQVIDNLEMNDWIDDMTAAVFVEFNIYQPTTSLFSAVKFLFERFPNGGTNTIIRVKTLTIYSPKDRFFRVIYETSQLLFMILLLFCVGAEIGKVYQQGCKYFKSPWSWLEIILLLSSVGSQTMFFLKESYTSKFVTKVQENPFQSWSMDNISLWSDLEVTLLAFVVFLITMKLLRIIRFNPHIIQMRMTLISASKHFTSFTLVFLTMIISYVTLTTLTFGSNVYEYRSFTKSFSTILLMLIGAKAPFHELRRINIIIGPFFVFAYMVTIVMIFLNMFLAILNDAYTESRKLGHEGSGDLELFKLMKLKAKKFSKKTRVAVIKVLEAIPQLLWQRRSETAVAFEKEAFVSSSWEERNEIFGFHEDNNPSLTDIIALLSEIKHDISDSILSIDDIVPRVTIDRDSESTRSCRPDSSSDSFDFHSCSSNSLFTSESESEIAKLENLIDLGDEDDFFHSDSFIMDKWYHRNAEVGETFV